MPVYGAGDNIRDWLYVEDHARALLLVLERGRVGETYNIGGGNERTQSSTWSTRFATARRDVAERRGRARD